MADVVSNDTAMDGQTSVVDAGKDPIYRRK